MKIVLTGPECSGKTTLAMELAGHHGVAVAPEPAREQLQPERSYQPSDLLELIQQQIRLEHHATAELQIFDTDLQNIYLWWQEKFGPAPTSRRAQLKARRPRPTSVASITRGAFLKCGP